MLIAYILFCFIALFMTYRRHRREKRIRQLEDHWERYYEYQYTQEGTNGNTSSRTYHQGTYHQGNRNPRFRRTVQMSSHRKGNSESLKKVYGNRLAVNQGGMIRNSKLTEDGWMVKLGILNTSFETLD